MIWQISCLTQACMVKSALFINVLTNQLPNFRDSCLNIAISATYVCTLAGNKEKATQRFLASIVALGQGSLASSLAQWKKSALFSRDSSPRATAPPYRSPCKLWKYSIAMVIECREANGNNSRCCHHDILSPGPRHILIISYFLCVIIPSNRCDLNFWVGLLNMLGFLHNRYYRQWSHSTMGTSPRYCLQWDRPLLLVGGDMLSYNTLPTQTRPSTIKKP